MKQQKWIVGPAALACSLGLAGLATAQPPANPGAAVNPPNQQPGANLRANWQNMTPEQRAAMIAQFTARRLRTVLTDAGFADAATQDPIIEFVNAQEKLRAPLREKATKLRDAVANKTADADVAPLVADLRAATDDFKKQRVDAMKALDDKISYSKKPRLEAFLTVGSFIGDEMSFAGGAGGRGGGAGGFGGGFGGAGGAAGQNGQGRQGGRRGGGRGGRGGNNGNANGGNANNL